MTGSSLLGRELQWHPSGETPGLWAFSLDGDPVSELWWSRDEQEVRAEDGLTVWRVPFRGGFLLQGAVISTLKATPDLLFAGNFRKGLADIPSGPRFTLFNTLDREHGPWSGINDESGAGVLRAVGRMGGGRIWRQVQVTPDPRQAPYLERLLLLWGGLWTLHRTAPWLGLTTFFASDGAIRRRLTRMLS
jgi:hypothetical protein